MSDKRKRAARAIMAETGWNYTRALREAGRRHAEGVPPSLPPVAVPDAAGEFLSSLLAPVTQPGPPYVHTFAPPEPIGQDEDGNDIYPEPGPAYTLTEGG